MSGEQVTNSTPTPAAAPVETPNTAPVETSDAEESIEENVTEEQPQGDKADGDKKTETKAEKKAKEEVKKRIKQLKLKVDGKELTEELPFEIDEDPKIVEYLQKQLQLAKMSGKRANEASTYKKQLDEVADYLKSAGADPKQARALLKELKIDEAKLIEVILQEAEELSKKTPEQLEREKLENELKALKEEREKEKKDAEQREYDRLVEMETQKYDTMIDEAISASELPKSPYVIKKVADYMLLGLQNKIDVNPKDIIPLVQQEIHDEFKQMINMMGEDKAEQFIGKEMLQKIRKKNLAKAKPPVPVNKSIVDAGKKTEKQPEAPKKKISFKEFLGV